jgi:hypothetical protein
VLNAKGEELHKLNKLVRQTSKFKEEVVFKTIQKICAKAATVQNRLTKLNRGADSPCLITVEFKRLRRSGQLASQTKRSYEAMQNANKRTDNMLKKPKLITGESADSEPTTNESANDKPATDEPASEPATLAINYSAIIKPNTIKLLKTSRDALHQEDTDAVIARSALINLDNKTTVSRQVDSNLFTITHANRIVILDKYFPKSAINSRPVDSVVAPDELLTFTADIGCQNSPFIPLIPSLTPKKINTSLDKVSSASFIPYPYQTTGGFEMSTLNTSSLQSVSSCRNSLSYLSSETNSTNIGLLDITTHTSFARRLVLDNAA